MSGIPAIGTLMTRLPHSVEADVGIHEVQEAMERHAVRHLPVTEGDRLVGIVTDRDLSLSLDPLSGLPPLRKVREIMVDQPYVVDVGTPVDEVLQTLADRRIGSALVTEDGKLVGIFTSTDAARLLAQRYREGS